MLLVLVLGLGNGRRVGWFNFIVWYLVVPPAFVYITQECPHSQLKLFVVVSTLVSVASKIPQVGICIPLSVFSFLATFFFRVFVFDCLFHSFVMHIDHCQ
jgi:hypothetical protein